jgi:hypothetical protein
MSKVYCQDCKNYWTGDLGGDCIYPNKTTDTWFAPVTDTLEPSVANANNDCPHYNGKRTLGEWFAVKRI